jgi:hypothetical protein
MKAWWSCLVRRNVSDHNYFSRHVIPQEDTEYRVHCYRDGQQCITIVCYALHFEPLWFIENHMVVDLSSLRTLWERWKIIQYLGTCVYCHRSECFNQLYMLSTWVWIYGIQMLNPITLLPYMFHWTSGIKKQQNIVTFLGTHYIFWCAEWVWSVNKRDKTFALLHLCTKLDLFSTYMMVEQTDWENESFCEISKQ